MAQAGNRAGKTQPCMQTGESEFDWVPVTSGNMNVCNPAFAFFIWPGLIAYIRKGALGLVTD